MSKNKVLTVVVSLVVAGIIAAVVVGFIARAGQSEQSGEDRETTTEPSTTVSERVEAPMNEGAVVGNNQRSWPDKSGLFDDGAHATPGEYAPDMFFSRPVWTPMNHDGDFPSGTDLKERGCEGTNGLHGRTQQQYVNARYMVVNTEAGPTRVERAIPRGYAHSPQGAAVAAMNALSFLPDGHDEVAKESFDQLWSSSEGARQSREFLGQGDPKHFANSRYRTVPVASGYGIVTCTKDLVVVDVAVPTIPENGAEEQYVVARLPMKWRDGDWTPDLSGHADGQIDQPSRDNLDGMVEVTYE